MRVSVKADYALRAMAALADEAADATEGPARPVPAVRLSEAQRIPLKFLQGLLTQLRQARLVRSTRGAEGGFELGRPAGEITLADVFRAIDGPLVNVHDESFTTLQYTGPAEPLLDVWMAARTSMRAVFERVTLADLAARRLPDDVAELAERYRADERHVEGRGT